MIEFVAHNDSFVLSMTVIIMSLLEFSKIKINPWTWLGNRFNKGMMEKIDTHTEEIKNLKKSMAEIERDMRYDQATSSRYRILRFNDELMQDKKHTKEHFNQIILDIDIYERFCECNKEYKNNIADMSIKNIKRIYQDCLDNKSFL